VGEMPIEQTQARLAVTAKRRAPLQPNLTLRSIINQQSQSFKGTENPLLLESISDWGWQWNLS
jgi:hypothetical protein